MRSIKIRLALGTALNIARFLSNEHIYTAWQWNALQHAILTDGNAEEDFDFSTYEGLRHLYERGGYL